MRKNRSSRAVDSRHPHSLETEVFGIHTGNVVQTSDDFFGTVVNKAARITALAAPGDVQVSDVTHKIVGETHDFRFTNMTSVQLEGFEGEHIIYRLE